MPAHHNEGFRRGRVWPSDSCQGGKTIPKDNANRGGPLIQTSASSSRQNLLSQNVLQSVASKVRENSPLSPMQLGNTSALNPPLGRSTEVLLPVGRRRYLRRIEAKA